ncbi:myosin-crossreactive antigen [Cutibacterium acnes JCM 18920]|nr:myosin-crossreactive antigen [Cutibacterium acnes JCM 18920]
MTNFQDIYQHSYPVSPDGNPFVQNDLGRYTQNHPVPPDDVAERKAYLVGSGIASLLAAAYLIRDARCLGRTSPSSRKCQNPAARSTEQGIRRKASSLAVVVRWDNTSSVSGTS